MYLNKHIVDDAYIADEEEAAHGIIYDIIASHEPGLVELNMGVVFRDHPLKKGGAIKWASIEKPRSLLQFFACQYYERYTDLIIQIDYGVWRRLDHFQKTALLHHELKHVRLEWDDNNDDYKRNKYTGRLEFMLVVHDKEEFRKIEDIYGSDWADQLRNEDGQEE